jgi:hypothetical protein
LQGDNAYDAESHGKQRARKAGTLDARRYSLVV